MVRIARKLETDRRTKRRIWVKTEKTQSILHFDNITLKLKLPEAKRISEQLGVSVEIIQDRKLRFTRTPNEELRII